MDFEYRDGKLYAEYVNVEKIIKQISTPVYIYSKHHFIQQFKKLDNAFSRNHVISYAIKANSNLNVIKIFSQLGCGADVVSKGELFRAKRSSVDSKKIVFSGVGKSDDEIEYALESNIMMINAESLDELLNINKIAEKLQKKADIALRVNPDVDPKTHPYISTGLNKNKFGIPYDEAYEIYIKSKDMKNINVKGIQFHIGSQLLDILPILDASKKILELIKMLSQKNINIDVIDVGGGLGIQYSDNEKEVDVNAYAKGIENIFTEFKDALIVCEPGRFLTANGGVFITKVLYHKNNGKKKFIIVDGAMNDLIRPSLYNVYHRIEPIKKITNRKIRCDIVGPICETGDFFAKNYEIEDVKNNNFLCIFSAGAYGFSMSSNYNSRRKAAEVLVENHNYKIIKQRETYEDIIKGEIL